MVSDEDKALFRNTMRSVKPLNSNKKIPHHKKNPTAPLPPKKDIPTHFYPLSHYNQDPVGPETLLTYGENRLPHKRWKQFKSGQIPWQGRLDLHGMTSDTASLALMRFIEEHSEQGHHCLLIIHGKGGRHHEMPILKNNVAHWLQQLPQTLAFHSAIPRDGGTGALYLLLRIKPHPLQR